MLFLSISLSEHVGKHRREKQLCETQGEEQVVRVAEPLPCHDGAQGPGQGQGGRRARREVMDGRCIAVSEHELVVELAGVSNHPKWT